MDLNHLIFLSAQFEPISLPQIQSAALLDRVDTKYIIGMDQLCDLLPELTEHYRMLAINDVRLHHYRTLYFDTNTFNLYAQHHNRRAARYKVRVRKYMDTDTVFFEIKRRTNQHRTIKSRVPIPNLVTRLNAPLIEFAQEHISCDVDSLEPKLWNEYMRMTLVSKYRPERVTVDMNIQYHWDETFIALSGVVIIEVKQSHHTPSTEVIQHLRNRNIRPQSYSKYTAGVYSLYDGVKVNNFKPQIRMVNRILKETVENEYAQ